MNHSFYQHGTPGSHTRKISFLRILVMLVAVAGVTVALSSCNRARSSSGTETCGLRRPDRQITASIDGERFELDAWNTIPGSYTFASGKPQSLPLLIHTAQMLQLPAPEKTVALAIYTSGSNSNYKVDGAGVKGVSRYYLDHNRLYHQFFLADSGVMRPVAMLEQEVPGLYTNNIHDLRKLFFENDITTVLCITSMDLLRPHLSVDNGLGPVIEKLQEKREADFSSRPGGQQGIATGG